MIIKSEHVIEGLNPDGDWVRIGVNLDPSCDLRAQRDRAVRKLREHAIKRYSKVRLAKYVTTVEVMGETIKV